MGGVSLPAGFTMRKPSCAPPTSSLMTTGVLRHTAARATHKTTPDGHKSHSKRRFCYLNGMIAPPQDLKQALSDAVGAYEASGNMGILMKRLHELRDSVMPDALVSAAEPWLHMPEVAGPLYERIVEDQPKNVRAIVILANAYWLSGRGPEVVDELATRALSLDPENRGAWHMWALTEGNPRDRTLRWMQVTQRFPGDFLAKAALADNAASLAGAEQDREALALAIKTYQELRDASTNEEQQTALDKALTTLRAWKF